VLVLAPLAATKLVYRRTNLPLVEPWVFVAAAIALCVVGAVVDVAWNLCGENISTPIAARQTQTASASRSTITMER
jgi:hypothetical protein